MKVSVTALTDKAQVNRAAEMTTHGQPVNAPLKAWYRTEHSPIRMREFWIEMEGIPTFVSVHLVRHNIGVDPFVMSNREDRGGAGDTVVNRLTPVNHGMKLNAESLINISKKRLCFKSSRETSAVWMRVKKAVAEIDPDLARFMVPMCVYRNGICPEFSECKPGLKNVMKAYSYYPKLHRRLEHDET
jgi:hypothetical protein